MTTITLPRATVEQALEALTAHADLLGTMYLKMDAITALRAALAQQDEPAQKQDPELSAALGWPGGISDPVLDRKVLLQMVAALRLASQQALEALEFENSWHETFKVRPYASTIDAITALRAALAQEQAEPTDPGFWGRAAARQASRIKQLEAVTQQALEGWNSGDLRVLGPAMGALRAALAQKQAEPVTGLDMFLDPQDELKPKRYKPKAEPVAWVASKDGRVIYDAVSTDDVLLRISGDFEDDEQRIRYTQQIVDALNAALLQRTMVPLTDEEILAAVGWERAEMYMKLTPNFPVDEAKKETLKNARVVEKASWEKNHG